MTTQIHSTAMISPGAQLGVDVHIGPYCVLGDAVRVGDRTRIGPQVVLEGVTHVGDDNVIVGQASLGNAPQDLSYKGEPTMVVIGHGNTIREFVTINRGTVKGGGVTRIGDRNLLMACSHVAHDCELEDNIILGNGVLLAGHSLVERNANVSGMAGAVAFCTIGAFSYVGAMTRMSRDVPPFMIVEGHDGRVRGVNVVGLTRSGFSSEDVDALRAAFKRIWRSGRPRKSMIEELRAESPLNPAVETLLHSMAQSEEGLKGRYRESLRARFSELGVQRILEGATTD